MKFFTGFVELFFYLPFLLLVLAAVVVGIIGIFSLVGWWTPLVILWGVAGVYVFLTGL